MATFDRHEADRLLTVLLDLPVDERTAVLDAECRDEALRAAVLRLLEAAEAPISLIDPASEWTGTLWEGLARTHTEHENPMAENERIGPYRVLGEIARGGMAVVYRAERIDGEFTRQVAVKVLKFNADASEAVRRFDQERQILADLDHPNIARMFDAGRTSDGRPYLVMELVEGRPIDRYCDEQRLSINERLRIFHVVVRAVEAAHQNLVVHRDLKPSNILVNRSGEVKLLDFGIARLLETDSDSETPATRPLLRMMTPEYASPEQVRGDRVTIASDTYQLGLLLYELLTGHRPYAFSSQSPGEFERVVCKQPPTCPSSSVCGQRVLKQSGGVDNSGIAEICRARRSSPGRLRRRLRGDLDNIALMALQKDPRHRYRTADQLAQDIRRHLSGSPVSARAQTWAYRTRKFLERHAIGAAVTMLLLIFLIGMSIFHTVRIQDERNRAQAAANKADQVSRFLTGLFESADPREARGTELTARELLDRGVLEVDTGLAGQPAAQAQMLQVLGRTYLELGVEDEAKTLLERSLELRQNLQGPEHAADAASTLTDLGLLYYRQGAFEHARDLLEEASRNLVAVPGDNLSKLAHTLLILGDVYTNLNRHEEAETTLRKSLETQAQASGMQSLPAARVIHRLGILLHAMNSVDQAEELHRHALDIYEHQLGNDHPETGHILMELARIMQMRGNIEEAETMYRRNIAIQNKAYGPTHVRIRMPLSNLAGLLMNSGQNEEAIELLQQAVEIQNKGRPDDPEGAFPLNNLGAVLLAEGRVLEAREAFERSAALRDQSIAEQRFDALQFHALVRILKADTLLEDHASADQSSQKALEMWRRAPPSTRDPRLTSSLHFLGGWLVEQQRCGEAIPLLQLASELSTGEHNAIQDLLLACSTATASGY